MASQNISQLGDFFYCPSCVLFNKKYRNVGQLEDVFTRLYWHKVTNNKLAGWLAMAAGEVEILSMFQFWGGEAVPLHTSF